MEFVSYDCGLGNLGLFVFWGASCGNAVESTSLKHVSGDVSSDVNVKAPPSCLVSYVTNLAPVYHAYIA